MKHRLAIALVAGALGGLSALALPCAAQTLSTPPSAPNQAPQTPQSGPHPSLTSAGVPGTVSSGTTSAISPAACSLPSSGPGMSFGTVGRGLPGLAGGPPVTAPMGARDPSASYMSPPAIGPLFCDPSLNIAC